MDRPCIKGVWAPDQSCDCGAGVGTKYYIRTCVFVSGYQQIYVDVVQSVGFQVCLHVSTEFNVQLGTNKIMGFTSVYITSKVS